MRRSGWDRRAAARRLTLLAAAALTLFLWGRYGDRENAVRALFARLLPPPAAATAAESAPPLPTAAAAGEETAETEKTKAAPDEEPVVPACTEEPAPPPAPEIRNDSSYSLDPEALPAPQVRLADTTEPQVLILHTHTSEAYTPDPAHDYVPDDNDRTLDPAFNVTAVGDRIEEVLEDAGIHVLHDGTINDYPSYSGSYSRALQVIRRRMEEHPEIAVVLDVHRDAVIYPDGTRFAPRAELDGRTAARVMLVVGTDDGGLTHDRWQENLAFAFLVQQTAETRYPGLMRPVNLRAARFNQHVSPGALLVEVGSSGNTLEEALTGAELFARALAETLNGLRSG